MVFLSGSDLKLKKKKGQQEMIRERNAQENLNTDRLLRSVWNLLKNRSGGVGRGRTEGEHSTGKTRSRLTVSW